MLYHCYTILVKKGVKNLGQQIYCIKRKVEYPVTNLILLAKYCLLRHRFYDPLM